MVCANDSFIYVWYGSDLLQRVPSMLKTGIWKQQKLITQKTALWKQH